MIVFLGQVEEFVGLTILATMMIAKVISITIITNNNTIKVLPNLFTFLIKKQNVNYLFRIY